MSDMNIEGQDEDGELPDFASVPIRNDVAEREGVDFEHGKVAQEFGIGNDDDSWSDDDNPTMDIYDITHIQHQEQKEKKKEEVVMVKKTVISNKCNISVFAIVFMAGITITQSNRLTMANEMKSLGEEASLPSRLFEFWFVVGQILGCFLAPVLTKRFQNSFSLCFFAFSMIYLP